MNSSSGIPSLSHLNHFSFGYDGNKFNFRTSADQKWWVEYGRCSRRPENFRNECIETAKLIRKNASDSIYIMFSGGVDSEVVLRSFVEAGIKVSAAILRFKNDLNIHDTSWAVIACEELAVPYRFFELDLLDFWKNEAWEYANSTYCISPQLLPTMWLVDQIEGFPVMGNGECLLVKQKGHDYQPGISPYDNSEWEIWEKEKIAAWYRFFIVRNRNGSPGFFQYTPEVMLSYLLDPFVQRLIKNKIKGKLTTESSKVEIYQQHFPVLARPKYTGFERVQKEDAELRQLLKSKWSFADEIYKIRSSELMKSLFPE
jgi:hypothetical protein